MIYVCIYNSIGSGLVSRRGEEKWWSVRWKWDVVWIATIRGSHSLDPNDAVDFARDPCRGITAMVLYRFTYTEASVDLKGSNGAPFHAAFSLIDTVEIGFQGRSHSFDENSENAGEDIYIFCRDINLTGDVRRVWRMIPLPWYRDFWMNRILRNNFLTKGNNFHFRKIWRSDSLNIWDTCIIWQVNNLMGYDRREDKGEGGREGKGRKRKYFLFFVF